MTENPLLLPLNKEKTVYDGFITVQVCKLADCFLHNGSVYQDSLQLQYIPVDACYISLWQC